MPSDRAARWPICGSAACASSGAVDREIRHAHGKSWFGSSTRRCGGLERRSFGEASERGDFPAFHPGFAASLRAGRRRCVCGAFRTEVIIFAAAASNMPVRSRDLRRFDASRLHAAQRSRAVAARALNLDALKTYKKMQGQDSRKTRWSGPSRITTAPLRQTRRKAFPDDRQAQGKERVRSIGARVRSRREAMRRQPSERSIGL